jgi:hypothetical protein
MSYGVVPGESFCMILQVPFSSCVAASQKKGGTGIRYRPFYVPSAKVFPRRVRAYFTSSIFTTFSYMDKIGIRQPYFQILTCLPFSRTASFWMFPESNLNR